MPSHAGSDPPPSVAESALTVGIMGKQSATNSTRGRHTPSHSTLRPVVTAPPWAKDEPESPTFDNITPERSPRPSGASTTHVPSIISDRPSLSTENLGGHHRWTFALPRPRPRPKPKRRRNSDSSSEGFGEGRAPHDGPSRASRPRWPSPRKRTSPEITPTSHHPDGLPPSRPSRAQTLRLQLPLPQPYAPFTISHSKTPGWNTPWTPRVPEAAYTGDRDNILRSENETGTSQVRTSNAGSALHTQDVEKLETGHLYYRSGMRKKIRGFLLHNNYILLVLRLLNLTFTTITLALAIRIRLIEKHHGHRGAVGSSPVLAVIFAPFTLVHVMVAIYLEYFGRPLGLWRTSAKLAHTLSEVLFICAWSAELSLCFDNYFTSRLYCAPHSAMGWYSDFPASSNPLDDDATSDPAKHMLCAYQLDLIGVVMVALLLYCTNLVISLFRIFEKVKVHHGWGSAR